MASESKSFPADKNEALTLLYIQSQDLTGKSPEDVAEMYQNAYKRISNKLREVSGQEPFFKDA